MKKGILLFSLVLMASLIVFGFNYQNTTSTGKYNIESKSQLHGKCGDGSSSETKTETTEKKECTKEEQAKCASKSKSGCSGHKAEANEKCGSAGKCGEGKCGGGKDGAAKCGVSNMDKNADGKVSFEEFSAHYKAEFPNCDKNKDGKVTSVECSMFSKFNSDKDDAMTEEEFKKGHENMFVEMDKNKDGFLDNEEFKSCCSGKEGAAKCAGESKSKEACKSESKPACKSDNKSAAPKCCGGGK